MIRYLKKNSSWNFWSIVVTCVKFHLENCSRSCMSQKSSLCYCATDQINRQTVQPYGHSYIPLQSGVLWNQARTDGEKRRFYVLFMVHRDLVLIKNHHNFNVYTHIYDQDIRLMHVLGKINNNMDFQMFIIWSADPSRWSNIESNIWSIKLNFQFTIL